MSDFNGVVKAPEEAKRCYCLELANYCMADACMKWRWVNISKEKDRNGEWLFERGDKGYCVLEKRLEEREDVATHKKDKELHK